MSDTLKVASRIGAELGAAKAENEKLRGLLEAALYYVPSNKTELRTLIDAALSQKAEPTDTYTAVEMATAAAQGFRDGQAAVEQAAAQDEREAVERFSPTTSVPHCGRASEVEAYMTEDDDGEYMTVSQHERIVAALTRPAQTEQQPDPVLCDFYEADDYPSLTSKLVGHVKQLQEAAQRNVKPWEDTFPPTLLPAYIRRIEAAAPIAQTAPQKYDDVLLPFLSMMRAELHANAGKGDRPGWLAMDVKTALLEIFYHIGKLQKAAKKGDRDGIREYSADVANMSMMLADICGVLPEHQVQAAPQPEQSGLDPHEIAQQVRESLDRQACPNAWMVIAYEATVTALSATPSPAKRGDA